MFQSSVSREICLSWNMFHRDIIVVLTPIFPVTCYHSVGYPLHSTGCPTVIIDDFTRAMPKTQHSKQMRAKKRHLVWSLRLCDKRSNSLQWNAMLLQFVFPHSYRSKTPWHVGVSEHVVILHARPQKGSAEIWYIYTFIIHIYIYIYKWYVHLI